VEALILAGGKAERLGDAAQGRPKPLVLVDGRPLAAYQVAQLADAGVTRIILACAAGTERLFETELGGIGPEIVAVGEPEPLGRGGGLRFAVVVRLAGSQLVQFKIDVSAADVIIGDLEEYLSDPVVQRLGLERNRYPVYPITQHVAEKLHALTLPRDAMNTRARDLVDLAWFRQNFTFRSDTLIDACRATFERRATHSWPPVIPVPPTDWDRPYQRWRAELDLNDATPALAAAAVAAFFRPVFAGTRGMRWDLATGHWESPHEGPNPVASPS